MKKTFLFVSLVCLLISTYAFAAGGTLPGTGTDTDPYLIEDVNDFDTFADPANAATYWAAGVHTKLMTDIDLSGRTYTTAVIAPDDDHITEGFQGIEFTGIFNGNGYNIHNLKIESESNDYLALFGCAGNNCEIRRAGLYNISILGNNCIGGFVALNKGFIEECFVKAHITGCGNYAGVFVGENQGFIRFAYSEGSVSGDDYVGGFSGCNNSSGIGITDGCYSASQVIGNNYKGGFVGYSEELYISPFYGCFFDRQRAGINTDDIAVGHRTVDLYNLYTYGRWTCGESAKKWNILSTQDYPKLLWENKAGSPICTESIWDGQGTKEDPYLIYNAGAFYAIGGSVECLLDKHFKLMDNIDLSYYDGKDGRPGLKAVAGISPVNIYEYLGSFNGNFYTIRNVNMTSNSQLMPSLFGIIGPNGKIENLIMENMSLQGSSCAALAISANIGAIIRNCNASVNLTFYDDSYINGGIGSLVSQNHALIEQCCVTGSITIDGISSERAGGLVASNERFGSIVQCYSDINIVGSGKLGGLTAENYGNISQCYTAGSVNNYNLAGALVAENKEGGIVTESYFVDVAGPDNGYGTPLDNPNMMIQANFVGWDFSEGDGDPVDWMMLREGEDYPRLAWQEVYGGDIAGLYGVDMVDFAYLANYWGLTGCNSGTDCGRADIDESGDVGLADLVYIAQDWLSK